MQDFHRPFHLQTRTTNHIGLSSGVTQGKKETLHAYIDHFTKVAIAIEGSDESLK